MLFAGIWAMGQDPKHGGEIQSACIITTSPNGVTAPLHNRMPVILDDELVDHWLDPDLHDLNALQLMLCPCPDEELDAYPVSEAVNRVGTEGPELVEPLHARASE